METPRDERFYLRMSKDEKTSLEQAASKAGFDEVSNFVVSLLQKAGVAIAPRQRGGHRPGSGRKPTKSADG